MSTEFNPQKAKKEIKAIGNNSFDIINYLCSLKLSSPMPKEIFINFVLELDNNKNINFLKCCKEALEEDIRVWNVAHIMEDILPKIKNIEIDILVDILEVFIKKMEGDLASGIFYKTIETTSLENKIFYKSIEREIKNRSNKKLLTYLMATYLGVSRFNFELGYSKILEFVNDKEYDVKSLGLRWLSFLNKDIVTKKSEVINILRKSNKHSNTQLLRGSAMLTSSLTRYFDELITDTIELSNSRIPEVQYELINFINSNQNKDWTKKCLSNLIKLIRSEHVGITKVLDNILSNNFSDVKMLLNDWISSREEKEIQKFTIDSTFPMTLPNLFENKNFMSLLLIEWLNSDNYRFHLSVQQLISSMSIKTIPPLLLDEKYLETLNFNEHRYIIQKILGCIYSFDYSIVFVYSFLKIKHKNKEIFRLIENVLVREIGYNYPVLTIQFLKNIEKKELSKNSQQCIENSIKIIEQYLADLNSLATLNELQPNNSLLIKISKEEQKIYQKYKKEAEKKSFISMFPKTPIKEGYNSFHYHNGNFSKITKMKSFSTSMSIPKEDILDEIGSAIKRINFLIIKK